MTLPEKYKNALTAAEGVARNHDLSWAVTGSIGRRLQGMELTEDQPDIDIVTDEESLELLYGELQEYSESDISYDARMEIDGNQISFHKFEAEIDDVEIEFLGDFEVDGEPVYENYEPNNVDVDGVQIPTVPLMLEDGRGELEGNRETGRNEIVNRIEAYLLEKK
jgi:hypothetical protein